MIHRANRWLERMVVPAPTRLGVSYRKIIGPLSHSVGTIALQPLLNVHPIKNVNPIFPRDIGNHLAPKILGWMAGANLRLRPRRLGTKRRPTGASGLVFDAVRPFLTPSVVAC